HVRHRRRVDVARARGFELAPLTAPGLDLGRGQESALGDLRQVDVEEPADLAPLERADASEARARPEVLELETAAGREFGRARGEVDRRAAGLPAREATF